VTGPRVFAYREEGFWDMYRDVPAWDFERFTEIAERGTARPAPARSKDPESARQTEREDLEASLAYTKQILSL